MAAGLVVIATTTGSTSELLVDQEAGLTFPAGNPEWLAKQICRIFKSPDLRLRLAKTGQERVEVHFSFKSMVGQMEDILQKIATDPSVK